MPSGKARIAEASTLGALKARQWSHRRPLPAGVVSLLTLACWAVWIYLLVPLLILVLWASGARLFVSEVSRVSYDALRTSLIGYSSILVVLVGLLGLWILWNVARYGGSNDRRTVKQTLVTDQEVEQVSRLSGNRLCALREERHLRIDLDEDDWVMVLSAVSARETRPAGPVFEQLAEPLRAVQPERAGTHVL